MLAASEWRKNQPNTVLFVLINDVAGEAPGLGSTFNVFLSKAGAAFVAGVGTKAEVGLGWYRYTATSAESNTSGPIALVVTGSGVVQQNMEYIVGDRVVTAVEFTYTVTNSVGGAVMPDVKVVITDDILGEEVVWMGVTDSLGVARDEYGNKPRLEPRLYYFFLQKDGYLFDNPDQETVS